MTATKSEITIEITGNILIISFLTFPTSDVESLDKTCTRYKLEISAEKTKLMTNSANGIQREIKVKGQKLGSVTSFKYLGAVVSDDVSKPEILSRIEQATAALTKLTPIWRDNNISLGSKVKPMRSLVISIFLYACETWTLTAELEKRTQAFEMRCYRRLLNISYKDHVSNEEVHRKIQAAIGEYDELLTLVKKRKLRWFGHVSRSSGLAKTILQGTVKGKRKRGRQKKRTLPAQLGQLKTGQDGKGLLRIHLWCPDDLPRLWDKKQQQQKKKRATSFIVLQCNRKRKAIIKRSLYIIQVFQSFNPNKLETCI